MANIKQFSFVNFPQDGKLGFRLPQSEPQFNWRNSPSIDQWREFVRYKVESYIAQFAASEFTEESARLATILENQLFMDALSKNDYMDAENFYDRVQNLVVRLCNGTSSAQKETAHATTSSPLYASASTLGMLNCNSSTNFNQLLPDHIMTSNAGCNLAFAPNRLIDKPRSSLYGPQKCVSLTNLQQCELVRSNNYCSGVGFPNTESSDSGTTYSGSVLQYDSEPSFESDRYKSQNFREGEFNLIMSGDQSSPSLHTPVMVGENLTREHPTVSNEVHMQQQFQRAQHASQGDTLTSSNEQQVTGTLCSAKGIIQPDSRSQGIGCKRLVCGDNCNITDLPEDFKSPLKYRKLNASFKVESSCEFSGSTEEPFSLSGSLNFEKLSLSPVLDTIAKLEDIVEVSTDDGHLNDVFKREVGIAINSSEEPSDSQKEFERVVSNVEDAARMIQAGNDTQYLKSNSADAAKFSEDLSANFGQKMIEPSFSKHEDKMSDSSCALPSDSAGNLCEDSSITHNVKFMLGDEEKIQANVTGEGSPSIAGSCAEMKSEKQKVDGISLIDFFTPEEVKQHMASLWQKADQDSAVETVGNEANRSPSSLSNNTCQLCALGLNLAFSIMPIYCSFCAARIKNHATYYFTKDDSCDQYCFCTSCYNKCPRGHFTLHGLTIPKTNLEARKNDLVTVESWVQCDRCEGWQHQVCALYNDNKDSGGNSEYLCPKCYLHDLEFGRRMPLPRSTSLDASDLPQTLLSDHLEQRLFRRLLQERENRAKAAGKNPEEVPQPADLVIRVVSSVDKILTVKQQFLDILPDKSYPAEFPYRSKVILLFQRIDGVDVCLFAMYVQEFGSACSQPNQRCVYISYLDSVKYFRPDIKTAKGEALRTFVYHEILVGYLDYCKKRGFTTCYIWACPPVKGEDYILYCHPETQKTPKHDKLRQWYQSMLKKATEEKIVVNFSNLYEKFFVHTGECNTKVTAARLPYFDGDYWSSVVENMIKDIELESGGDPQKKVKKMTRRSLKALGHINPSADDAKDILLMKELKETISKAKEDFIVVYLQFVCSHCHEVISGKRWFCSQCRDYQRCERCHVGEQSGLGNTHTSSGGHKHALSQEVVNDVPVDTEDNDEVMDRCFLENRHALLSFCQGNHYQFDSLRRAKHSSMMILYHLHNSNGSNTGTLCSLCLKDTDLDPRWICKICPEFSVCNKCYKKDPSCHNHTLRNLEIKTPKLDQSCHNTLRSIEPKTTKFVKQLLDVLIHASGCHSHPCSYPNCTAVRRLFSHAHACNLRSVGGCSRCKKAWFIMLVHSRRCKDSKCGVPRCMDLKNHTRLSLESKTERREWSSEVNRQSLLT